MTLTTPHDQTIASQPLLQPMFDGPLDVVADVHGEIDALRSLLGHLGYDQRGRHAQGRRLVFLGDLVDRGPDSVAVVQTVQQLIDAGKAQCVMGNHELNILLDKPKPDNGWFFGHDTTSRDMKTASDSQKSAVLRFIRRLPLALHREDLRAVHACWHDDSITHAQQTHDARDLHDRHARDIEARLEQQRVNDPVERSLIKQNHNPVKVLTSGPEHRVKQPFEAGGKLRHEGRLPWWEEYDHRAFCVFGHYWRRPVDGKLTGEKLFQGYEDHHLLGPGRSMCIDYSVGSRAHQRRRGDQQFTGNLAALRWPERTLVYEDGKQQPVSQARQSS